LYLARSRWLCSARWRSSLGCFFFQAEDGIRDWSVTGVQTCALPICGARQPGRRARVARARGGDRPARPLRGSLAARGGVRLAPEIGRASCRERGETPGGRGAVTKKI